MRFRGLIVQFINPRPIALEIDDDKSPDSAQIQHLIAVQRVKGDERKSGPDVADQEVEAIDVDVRVGQPHNLQLGVHQAVKAFEFGEQGIGQSLQPTMGGWMQDRQKHLYAGHPGLRSTRSCPSR